TPLERHLQAENQLPPVRRLLVVSDLSWAAVPLEALGGTYTISYVPSGTVYARLKETHRPVQGGTLLALGDPVFSVQRPPPPEHGLLVHLVVPGSNAARAGLRSGDVLLACGKTQLRSLDDLKNARTAGPAPFIYWREGERGTVRLPGGPLGVVLD